MEQESSRRRRAPRNKILRDANGRPICRQCHEVIPRGRYAYCSELCAREYLIRADPDFAGLEFRRRFGTRCTGCGLDEDVARTAYDRALALLVGTAAEGLLRPWEPFAMDHIRPVADGGGECGLENYRLLCRRCHGGVTGKWLRERAARRRAGGPWAASARQRSGYRVPV